MRRAAVLALIVCALSCTLSRDSAYNAPCRTDADCGSFACDEAVHICVAASGEGEGAVGEGEGVAGEGEGEGVVGEGEGEGEGEGAPPDPPHFAHLDHFGTCAATTDVNTGVGDLLLLGIYVEPVGASYGALTGPAGFDLAAWTPIASNDEHLGAQETNRFYLWTGYAASAGAQSLSVQTELSLYCEAELIRVVGGSTSGDPFVDVPDGDHSVGTGTFPSLSITTGAPSSLVISWMTSWHSVGDTPQDYTLDDRIGVFTVSHIVQRSPGTVNLVGAVDSVPDDENTGALFALRPP